MPSVAKTGIEWALQAGISLSVSEGDGDTWAFGWGVSDGSVGHPEVDIRLGDRPLRHSATAVTAFVAGICWILWWASTAATPNDAGALGWGDRLPGGGEKRGGNQKISGGLVIDFLLSQPFGAPVGWVFDFIESIFEFGDGGIVFEGEVDDGWDGNFRMIFIDDGGEFQTKFSGDWYQLRERKAIELALSIEQGIGIGIEVEGTGDRVDGKDTAAECAFRVRFLDSDFIGGAFPPVVVIHLLELAVLIGLQERCGLVGASNTGQEIGGLSEGPVGHGKGLGIRNVFEHIPGFQEVCIGTGIPAGFFVILAQSQFYIGGKGRLGVVVNVGFQSGHDITGDIIGDVQESLDFRGFLRWDRAIGQGFELAPSAGILQGEQTGFRFFDQA